MITRYEVASVAAYLLARGFHRGPKTVTGLRPVAAAAVRLAQVQDLMFDSERPLSDPSFGWFHIALIRSRTPY